MKRQSKIKRSNPGAAPSTAPPSVITNNLGNIAKVLGVLAAALLALTVWKSSQSVIQNLVNADAEVLKGAIFGDTPYMFYCARGGKNEIIPAQFSEVNALRGSNVGFAMVNCSQMLPSGKNLWERFKLKKEWRPTLFAAAPWLRAPLQVNPTHMKDGKTLAKFVDTSMAPKPTEISSDKELRRYCGFDKANVTDVRSITDTCLILLRGSRYSKIHSDLERKLVQAYPRVRMAAISASKRRLSLEEEMLPADHFALKLHALRNGTHYLTMVNPATWDYMNTFVGQAVGTPLYGFSGEGAEPIRLIKAPAPKKEKKVKAQKGGSGAGGAGAGGDKAETGAGAGSGSGSGSGSGTGKTGPKSDARRYFWAWNSSFPLLNVHLLNLPLAGADFLLSAAPLTFFDLWVSLLVALLYCLFYLNVLDARGLQFYIVFTPRTPLCFFSYVVVISAYWGFYNLWNSLLAAMPI